VKDQFLGSERRERRRKEEGKKRRKEGSGFRCRLPPCRHPAIDSNPFKQEMVVSLSSGGSGVNLARFWAVAGLWKIVDNLLPVSSLILRPVYSNQRLLGGRGEFTNLVGRHVEHAAIEIHLLWTPLTCSFNRDPTWVTITLLNPPLLIYMKDPASKMSPATPVAPALTSASTLLT